MTRVADVLYEYTEVLGVDEEPPVLTLTERQGFVPQGERFKKRLATEDTSYYKVVRRDDIAFNPYLLWAGALAQNTTCDRGIISPVYPTFRVRERFNARYVGHLLLSPRMIARYDTIAFGSVPRRRRSSVRDFLELEIPEPPSLEEQQRIAALLDTARAIRSTRTRTLHALDTLIRSTFVDMFGDPVSSTAQPRKALGDVAEIVTGNTPARRSTDNYGEHIEWLKSDNILTSGEVAPASEGLSKLGRRKGREAPAGATLVVCIAGSSKSIGRAGYLDRSAAFNQQINAVIAGPNLVTEFLFHQLRVGQRLVQRASTNAMKGMVSKSALEAVTIAVPPISDQKRFVEVVSRAKSVQQTAMRSLQELDALFKSLQHRAFRAEL